MKKRVWRIMALFLGLLLALMPVVPASAAESTVVTGTFTASGESFGSHGAARTMYLKDGETSPYFDYRWLTAYCPDAYNQNLALIANLLSTDCYDECCVTLGSSTDVSQGTILMSDLGFTDTRLVSLSPDDYAVDKDDLTSVALGHRVIEVDGREYNVFVAAVSGTRSNTADWLSNFDVGLDSDDYYEISTVGRSHPDWLNKAHHKGFDVASTRIKRVIDGYIRDHAAEGAQTTLLVTGHSRGAAIANILGAAYEADPDIQSYTYTFATPAVTTEEASVTENCRTVFNVVNEDDFVSCMPLPQWGFRRYGRDLSMKIFGNTEVVNTVKTYLGSYTCPSIASITASILRAVESREALYTPHIISEPYYDTDKDTSGEVLYDQCKQQLERYRTLGGDDSLFSFEIVPDGTYDATTGRTLLGTISKCYRMAFLTKGLAQIMRHLNDSQLFTHMEALSCIVANAATLDELRTMSQMELPAGNVYFTILVNSMMLPYPHYTVSSYVITLFTQDEARLHTGGSASCTAGRICESCHCMYGAADPGNHLHTAYRNRVRTLDGYRADLYCLDCGVLIEGNVLMPATMDNFPLIPCAALLLASLCVMILCAWKNAQNRKGRIHVRTAGDNRR